MKIILYIKIHNKTGMKYFGKTTKSDPHKYTGSGIYWKRHIQKYGYDVTTIIVGEFTNVDECTKFAIDFSKEHRIVESEEWANLSIENGVDGAPIGHSGHKFTIEELEKISAASKSRWKDPEYKNKMSEIHKKLWQNNPERREKQISRLIGVKRPEHAEKMKGRIVSPETRVKQKKPKHKNHGKLVSASLTGKTKSENHKQKLRVPKNRICRLTDKKEMSVGHYTRWLQTLIHT
jgi:hypothetical protein